MELCPAGSFEISGLESMSSWAEDLKAIPSTTISGHRKILVDCDARVERLLAPPPLSQVRIGTPRKSIRHRPKAMVETAGASGSTETPQKTVDTFVNAV